MKAICPICKIEGSAQIRGNSVRVGHYKGYHGETRIVEWHPTTLEALNMVNNLVNNNLKNDSEYQNNRAEVGKRYSARLISCNLMVNNVRESKMVNKSFEEYRAKALELCHNDYKDFLELYADYLINLKKVSKAVCYEYIREAKKFLEPIHVEFISEKGVSSEKLKDRVSEFLNVENPNTYRNKLASLKSLYELLGIKENLKDYKYKSVMPSFSIATPSLEDMVKFGKAIRHKRTRIYYYLGCVSAIRPEHLLRLRKGLFDKQNNMINTWQKTFGKKNFFFSFYTEEVKSMIEEYLDKLPMDSLLFPYQYRFCQDEFERTSKRCGFKMSPKMMRKFCTNWLRRHGMISEDVDAITSHMPKSVIAKHYLDMSRIKQEYDKATQDLKLL
jgi:integrase